MVGGGKEARVFREFFIFNIGIFQVREEEDRSSDRSPVLEEERLVRMKERREGEGMFLER